MKKIFLAVCFLCAASGAFAQSKTHKLGLTLGFGPQDYKGELGNGFGISRYDVWRGAIAMHAAYYINRSFDAGMFGSIGDFGFCQPDDVTIEPVDDDDRCPGCVGRVGLGNLSGRITAAGFMLKYKFANGYLLKEKSRIQPYIFAGTAYNKITDPMKMNCVMTGDYLTINAGAGFKVYLTQRINVGYNVAFGYFNRDEVDFMAHDDSPLNDSYMQNVISVGVDLF